MSIEKALEANTKSNLELAEAVREQTELLKSRLSGGTAKPTEKAAAKEEPKEEKPKAADKKPAAKKTTAKKETKKEEPELTAETLRDRFQEYMLGAPKGSDERKARIEKCREVLAHFNVEGVSEIPEESWEEALGYCVQLENGEELEFPESEEEAAEEDELPI